MPAYVIVDIDVYDPETFEEYRKLAPASIAAFGGRYLARGGETAVLEGTWEPKRIVLLEFESMDRARAWIESTEYAPARKLRRAAARANMVAVQGV